MMQGMSLIMIMKIMNTVLLKVMMLLLLIVMMTLNMQKKQGFRGHLTLNTCKIRGFTAHLTLNTCKNAGFAAPREHFDPENRTEIRFAQVLAEKGPRKRDRADFEENGRFHMKTLYWKRPFRKGPENLEKSGTRELRRGKYEEKELQRGKMKRNPYDLGILEQFAH